MSKSIYEEALDILGDILVDSFSDPQDEYNDYYMLNFKQIIEIEKAIKKAQKQEKLLELYRYLNENTISYDLPYDEEEEITSKIDEIENKLKEEMK